MSNLLHDNIELLLNGLATNNIDVTSDAIYSIKKMLFREQVSRDLAFHAILEVLSSNTAKKSMCTSSVVRYFESFFPTFTANQKKKLLALIKTHYEDYQDWMVWFSFSEILGEKFSTFESLNVVKHLNKRVRGKPRIFIPHAFEHHVTDSSSTLVRTMALKALKQLLIRQPLDVVRETKISLRRVQLRQKNTLVKTYAGIGAV
jgi:hypothetical protein